ncbi:hypothetical protein DFH07DRAFT_1068278, partial [Mycena maculata]
MADILVQRTPPTPGNVKDAVCNASLNFISVIGSDIPAPAVDAIAVDENEIITPRQIALVPQPVPPAPAPGAAPQAPAAPMAGIALALQAIVAVDQKLDTLLTTVNDLKCQTVINGNLAKHTGILIPFSEVLFIDGTRPTVAVAAVAAQGGQPAQPGRPALPLINNCREE